MIVLSPFAPFIQLLAGIYLLFFYEPLLSKSPLHETRERIRDLYHSFLFNYYELLPADAVERGESLVKNVWGDFLLGIRNIAALSFFYCMLVLAYIGVENSVEYGDYIYAMQVINIAVISYQCIAMLMIRHNIFHTYWTPVAFIVVMIIYFHNYEAVNDFFSTRIYDFGSYPSASSVVVFTMFTVAAPIPIVAIKIFYNAVTLHRQQKSIEKIDSNFNQFSQVMTSVKTINEISPELCERIKKRAADRFADAGEVTQADLYAFIEDEIKDEYDALLRRLPQL